MELDEKNDDLENDFFAKFNKIEYDDSSDDENKKKPKSNTKIQIKVGYNLKEKLTSFLNFFFQFKKKNPKKSETTDILINNLK